MRRLSGLSGFDEDEDADDLWQIRKTVSEDAYSSLNVEESDPEPTEDAFSVEKPHVMQVPLEMWVDLVETATKCWNHGCAEGARKPEEIFSELTQCFRCLPLRPRDDPDIELCQLMKDMKRETFFVQGEKIVGATEFGVFYAKLEEIIKSSVQDISETMLEHQVNRLLRACSRTVSGFDAYQVVQALMGRSEAPKALVTPGMMDNSPIHINLEEKSVLMISSINVFKVSKELTNGSLDTVIMFRTEVTERVELDTWHMMRWISLKPFDRVRECLNHVEIMQEKLYTAINSEAFASDADPALKKQRLLDFASALKDSLQLAVDSSIKAIRELAHSEYQRGREDAMSKTESDIIVIKKDKSFMEKIRGLGKSE